MNRQAIALGRILGIPIGLDYSWFVVVAFLTWSLAASLFPAEFPSWTPALYWVIGAATALMLFASVLVHELGHSIVARRYQIPVRSITLFIFGGVAQIGAEPPSARAEFWIAIAGPVVSAVLAAVFGLLRLAAAPVAPLLAMAEYLAYINGSLALFNLVPGFPLDGGRILRAILWSTTRSLRRATLLAATVGRGIAFLFILVGVFRVFSGDLVGGLWIAFIGWFLEGAATRQVQQQMVQSLLAGHHVAEAMSTNYAVVSAGATLQDLVDDHILASGRRSFVVVRDDELVGLSTLHRIKEFPRDRWAQVAVAEAMIPVEHLRWIKPEAELISAIEQMDRDGVNQLPVMRNRHLLGMISRDDVLSYLRTLQELAA